MFARACRALPFAVALLLVPSGPAGAESPTGPAPVTIPFELDDRITVSVNPASGNLFLSQQDDALTTADGTHWDLSRYYNSQGQIAEDFGWGWSGRETALRLPASGDASITQLDAGGYQRPFTKLGSAFVNQLDDGVVLAYIDPNAGRSGGYTATYPDGTVRSYYGTGEETSEVRPGGHTVTNFAEYPNSIYTAWTYSDGPTVGVGYIGWYGEVDGMDDLHGNTHDLHVEADQIHLLDQHIHPDGRVTNYEYPDWDGIGPPPQTTKLSRVSTSTGVDARFLYDAQNRITQVKLIDPADQSEDIWTFAYTAPDDECSDGSTVKTTVSHPNGDTAYYCSNALYEVIDANDDVVLDWGDGDDGSCTAPPGEPLDCGEGDLSPEDADPSEELQAFDVPDIVGWGIATDDAVLDDELNVFEEALFRDLEIRHVRHILPWNAAWSPDTNTNGVPDQLEEPVRWVVEALETNETNGAPDPKIVFSFEKCRDANKYPAGIAKCSRPGGEEGDGAAPTPDTFEDAMDAYFALVDAAGPGSPLEPLRRVRQFTAWNEPNLEPHQPDDPTYALDDYGQPVGYVNENPNVATNWQNSGAFRAGLYWKRLNAICKRPSRPFGCSVIAGDFSDWGMAKAGSGRNYGARYIRQYRDGMGHTPTTWAWHAYDDTNQRVTKHRNGSMETRLADRWKRYKAFEKAIRRPDNKPDIFITEVGVVRQITDRNGVVKKPLAGRVDAAMECLVGELPNLSPRIKRFYYYQYVGNARHDSGLVNFTNHAKRTAYDTFVDAKDGDTVTCPVAP